MPVLCPVAEASHRIEGGSTVDNVDIEEGEESQDEIGSIGSTEIPLQCVQCFLDGVECDNVLEVVEPLVAFVRVRKVSEFCVAPIDCLEVYSGERPGLDTYGQERIETKTMPMTMADLTRKAIKKVVSRPPQTIPSHILSQFSKGP